jgi:hypothetical protein
MTLSLEDAQAIAGAARRLGVDPRVLGGLMELESGVDPNIWGGAGGQYRGLIQFGPGARKEVGLPDGPMTISQQMPYVEKYFQQRGFQPGKHGPVELYRTVLVGNPNQSGTDSFGTNSDKAAQRMQSGGDLYKRFAAKFDPIASKLGDIREPANGMTSFWVPGQQQSSGEAANSIESFMRSEVPEPVRFDPMLAVGSTESAAEALAAAGLAQAMKRSQGGRMAGSPEFRESARATQDQLEVLRAQVAENSIAPITGRAAKDLFAPARTIAPPAEGGPVDGLQAMFGGGGGQEAATSTPMAAGAPSGGPLRVGRIAKPEEDVFPTTGPHLHVGIQDAQGEYINPANAKSLLQNLYVGGKPLYQQTGSGALEPSYPVTSPFGSRAAPTAGASTSHRGKDFGVGANTPLEWRGGGSYSFSGGVGVINLPDGRRVKLLHTRPS